MKLNEKGAMTLDFVFALVLTGAISAVLIALSYTLVMAEAAQYVAFSVSRTYFGAHRTKDLQTDVAKEKFDQLMSVKAIGGLLNSSWIKVTYDKTGDEFAGEYPTTDSANLNRDILEGTRLKFQADVLALKLPFLGETGESGAFATTVNSFLGREPSMDECMKFVNERWKEIIRVVGDIPQNAKPDAYFAIVDDGC